MNYPDTKHCLGASYPKYELVLALTPTLLVLLEYARQSASSLRFVMIICIERSMRIMHTTTRVRTMLYSLESTSTS